MNVGDVIIERKQKPDGTVREYRCGLAYASSTLVVVRFDMPNGGVEFDTPFNVPPRSWSFGFFWPRRPFNLYRMRGPGGEVLGHRFDAVTDVRFTEGEVSYRDLALDWWVLPDDTLIEEDRDEFEDLVAAGKLSHQDARAANEAAKHIYSRYRHVIDDVAILERRLSIVP
jgi:hypothetical protein